MFLVGSIAIDFLSFSLSFYNSNTLWLGHLYTLFEYSFLVFMFSFWPQNNEYRKNLRLSILLFTTIWITAKLFVEDLSQFDNYTTSLESVLILIFSGHLLYALQKENIQYLFREPRFWISCGIFIYFSGNLLMFSLFNIMGAASLGDLIFYWPIIHSSMNIVENLCFTGAFLCHLYRPSYGGLLVSGL